MSAIVVVGSEIRFVVDTAWNRIGDIACDDGVIVNDDAAVDDDGGAEMMQIKICSLLIAVGEMDDGFVHFVQAAYSFRWFV